MSSACIAKALRLQFGGDRHSAASTSHLDQCLLVSSRQILQQTIKFELAKQQTSSHISELKAKYPPINPKANMAPVANINQNGKLKKLGFFLYLKNIIIYYD